MKLTRTGVGVLVTSAAVGYGAVLFASPALGLVAVAGLLALTVGMLLITFSSRPTASVSLDTVVVRRGGLVTAHIRFVPTGLLLRTEVDLGIREFESAVVADAPTGAATPSQTASGTERTISLRATRHGEVTVGPPALTQTDPFGLCRRVTRTSEASSLLVRPALVPIPHIDTHSWSLSFVSGRGTSADRGEFDTLRAYEPGDDIRLIHWPNSARTGEILVRRHATPPTREFVVLHDTVAASYAAVEHFEEAVDFAASVVAAATARGLALRLCTTSGALVWRWPTGGRCTEADIARAFVSIQPQATEPGVTPSGPVELGRSNRGALVGAAACTIVTSEPRAQLLRALDDSALPMQVTLVCIGPRRPAEPVLRWARARGAALVDAADARGAAAQWSIRIGASP